MPRISRERTGELEAFVYGRLRVIDNGHRDARFLCCYESYAQSLFTGQQQLLQTFRPLRTICPAPTTPNFLTSCAATAGVELKHLICRPQCSSCRRAA